jgi:hypothetical protein
MSKRGLFQYHVKLAAVCLGFLALLGCGGNKAKKAASFEEANVGDLITVEGTLSLRGSTPHTYVALETDEDGLVVIQSGTLRQELRELSGMRVSIQGKVLPSIDGESPQVDAQSYKLLALPSGEIPLMGRVRLMDGQCVLETADKKLYWIRGDFVDVLKGYEGAKVWVVGPVGDAALPEKPQGSVPIQVTGYGVLSAS